MNRKQLFFSLLALLVGVGLMQCTDSPSEPEDEIYEGLLPRALTAEEIELAGSANIFGLKLFQEVVRQQPDSNIFISPLSVSMALGMTANGAAGAPLDAMRSTLELDGLTEEESNAAYQSLIELLTQADPQVQFDLANSVWYRLGLTLKEDFCERCRVYFDALVRDLDFGSSGAADTMNAWVSENTQGTIEEIVDKPISPSTFMFLINTIYFKGTWVFEFDPNKTHDSTFTLLDGSLVNCRMMEQRSEFPYLENDQFQAVDLPYGDGIFSMTVLLPKQGVHIDTLIASLTRENWEQWISSMAPDSVNVWLPKFKLEYGQTLNDVLEALGMGVAFGDGADFSRMISGGECAWIDSVKHKTFVQVDEEGTEAAAATVVIMGWGGPASINLRIDRPFMLAIRERSSGTSLFMGKIVEPVWEEE